MGRKILEDKFIARMLLKGYVIVLTSISHGTTMQVLNLNKMDPRPTMNKDGTLVRNGSPHMNLVSIYRLHHPASRNYRYHFEDHEQTSWGTSREFQHIIEEDRDAAIRVFETLRYIRKSKLNAKRYRKAKEL